MLAVAWLGSFLPAALPALAPGRWPGEWAQHVAAGWPATAALLPHVLGWLIAGALARALPGAAHAWRSLALAAGTVLALRFTWFAATAANAEMVGALIALAAWPLAERLPGVWRERLLAVAAAAVVLYAHLAPHVAGVQPHGVHWLPFTDLARPAWHLAALSAKVFWYGGLVWLVAAAGVRPLAAGLAVAATLVAIDGVRLVATPAVQYVTMTDPALALVAGLALALLARGHAAR